MTAGNGVSLPLAASFSGCALDAVGLLTQDNGSGQCGSWALLLEYAFAANGIQIQTPPVPNSAARVWYTWVVPTDRQLMVIKDWEFSPTPTYSGDHPYALTTNALPELMVPHTGMQYRDLTNLSTVFGQNSRPPSEKVFTQHFIVRVLPDLLTDPGAPVYFDPSYGLTYADGAAFQSRSVAGFARQDPAYPAGLGNWVVQSVGPTTPTNITLAGSPAAPALVSPVDLSAVSAASVTLSWSVVVGATRYNLYLGTASPPPYFGYVEGGTSAAVTPPPLTTGSTYYWYVTAYNPAGESFPSGIWRFTTH